MKRVKPKLIKPNLARLLIFILIINLTTDLLSNSWPHMRALFWISSPMKNRVSAKTFIKHPATRALILLEHAKYRVDSLIRAMPNDFDRTLSLEDRHREALLTRQFTERIYPELAHKRDPIIEYLETLSDRTHNQHPTLAIKPKIFLASNIKSTLLKVADPDIIINYKEFMCLGNPTQSTKLTPLTNGQQFLLSTTWQALSYGDQYINRNLSRVLELTPLKDRPTLSEQAAAIIIAQKLRNDLAAANTTTIDGSGKLMGAGIHLLNRLAHRKYDQNQRHYSETIITSPAETQTRLASLITARNLIENSDRRS